MTSAASSRRRGSTTRSSSRTWGTVSAGDFFPQLEPQPDQEVVGQEGHRQMMMPADPAPHLVLIHAEFRALLGRLIDEIRRNVTGAVGWGSGSDQGDHPLIGRRIQYNASSAHY